VSKATTPAAADLAVLAEALAAIEPKADKLPWASERPWRTETHLWVEAGVPTIDLHDLGPALAKAVVGTLAQVGEALSAGAVCLITGRGRHSLGRAVLPQVVGEALGDIAHARGWRLRQGAAGRLILITNEHSAPRAARGTLGPAFWIAAAAFGALAAWAIPPLGIAIGAVVIVWLIAARNR
jgi:hypothetical protein